MTRTPGPRRGVSLIEIMVVCVIIGILARMSIPRFFISMEQSRANIAVAKLQTIWTAQRVYWLQNSSTYAPDIATLRALNYVDAAILDQNSYDALGVSDKAKISYIFSITTTAGGAGFQAIAVRVGLPPNPPVWSSTLAIDSTGVVTGNVQYTGTSRDFATSGPNHDGKLDQFFQ